MAAPAKAAATIRASSAVSMARPRSRQPRAGSDIGGFGPFASADFRTVGLHAGDLEAAVGADHGETVAFDRDDLAEFASDALRIFRRQRLGIENLQRLAVERAPRAGRGIAA